MRRVLLGLLLGPLLLLAACTSSGRPAHRASSALGPVAAPSTASRAAAGPTPSSHSATVATSSHRAPSTSAHRTTHAAPTGLTVVLNPGHNGGNATHAAEINRQVPAGYGRYKACDTTGTNTTAGYPEHAFTWDVALRVRKILRAHGIHVIMTRPDDTGVGPCVDERAAIGNHSYVAAVVSIHADGAPSRGHGFHVNQDSRRPDGASAAVAAASYALGRAEHAALVRSSGLVPSTYIGSDGYYYRTDLAGLDLATRPATFLELGNMKNGHDAALQTSASGRQQIARAVAAGILAFLGR